MNQQEILKTVEDLFKDVLDAEEIVLTPATEGDDIEEWDSFNTCSVDCGY